MSTDAGTDASTSPPGASPGVDLIFFGSGFLYASDAEEIEAEGRNFRHATTLDMQAIALNTSKNSVAVGSLDEVLTTLKGLNDTLKQLRIVGHSNGTIFSFAGKMDPNSADLNWERVGDQISRDTLVARRKAIEGAVKDKFASGAEVILYGCHSGKGYRVGQLIQIAADFFGVRVRGFQLPIESCIKFKQERRNIVGIEAIARGWFRVRPAGSGRFRKRLPCYQQGFTNKLDGLTPDFWRDPAAP